jgi:predicted nucleic acid-binding protein
VLVVDASVLAPAIIDGGPSGAQIRARLRGETLAGPDLLRTEVMSVVRRHHAAGHLTLAQAGHAVDDLVAFPLVVHPSAPLLRRVWALRSNLTVYDACYVALAEALACPLLTADRRLSNAAGARCGIEVVASL